MRLEHALPFNIFDFRVWILKRLPVLTLGGGIYKMIAIRNKLIRFIKLEKLLLFKVAQKNLSKIKYFLLVRGNW